MIALLYYYFIECYHFIQLLFKSKKYLFGLFFPGTPAFTFAIISFSRSVKGLWCLSLNRIMCRTSYRRSNSDTPPHMVDISLFLFCNCPNTILHCWNILVFNYINFQLCKAFVTSFIPMYWLITLQVSILNIQIKK